MPATRSKGRRRKRLQHFFQSEWRSLRMALAQGHNRIERQLECLRVVGASRCGRDCPPGVHLWWRKFCEAVSLQRAMNLCNASFVTGSPPAIDRLRRPPGLSKNSRFRCFAGVANHGSSLVPTEVDTHAGSRPEAIGQNRADYALSRPSNCENVCFFGYAVKVPPPRAPDHWRTGCKAH